MTKTALDLRTRLTDPGFVPGAAHFEELFVLLAAAAREDTPPIERALGRAGERALLAVLARLEGSTPELKARLLSVLARLADPRASEALRRALKDEDPRVVRRAANALGKLEHDAANDRALCEAWERADTLVRRSLAEALGKVGGPQAQALLDAESSGDPELARLVGKAQLLLERRQARGTASGIVTDAPLGRSLSLLVRCRAGLAELLHDELRPLGNATLVAENVVELAFGGALRELFVARTALDFGVRIELDAVEEDVLPAAVGRALASEEARLVLGAWTSGSPRYRLSLSEGGHRRALVFRIAEAVGRAVPGLVNDPRDASWEVVLVTRRPRPHLVLVPLAFEDPRFLYRKREVRAASHPTLAAALARVAGVRADDHVWDPFVGSGLELIERARLGPYGKLLGSDIDPDALDAARENCTRAGVDPELRLADATRAEPGRVTLIITNPPMGRRLVRDRSLGALLDAFVAHAARVLEPGGRLVWLSPLPERTTQAAARAGLRPTPGRLVDMGGFEADLQTLRKP